MSDRIPVSLWLKEGTPKLYRCMYCGESFTFMTEGDIKTLLVGIDAAEIKENYRPLQFPIRYRCRGKHIKYGRCQLEYIIQGIIDN